MIKNVIAYFINTYSNKNKIGNISKLWQESYKYKIVIYKLQL